MKETIRQAIDSNVLMGLRVIFGSFLMGVLVFTLFSVIMYFDQAGNPDLEIPLESNATLLTYLALGFMVVTIPVSSILFKRFLKTDQKADALVVIANIRSAMLIRLALFEGAALFAATALLIASMDGFLVGNPNLWINLVPIGYFTLHIVANWPTEARIVSIYENYYI
jgi:hypothetical protein